MAIPKLKLEKESTIGVNIFVIGMMIACLLFIIALLDTTMWDDKLYNKIAFESDCKFVVPERFKLLYNKESDIYIIQENSGYEAQFLYTSSHSMIRSTSISVFRPSSFSDSCAAKGYLKAYIDQSKPTIDLRNYE